jgi:hypothetical protein
MFDTRGVYFLTRLPSPVPRRKRQDARLCAKNDFDFALKRASDAKCEAARPPTCAMLAARNFQLISPRP